MTFSIFSFSRAFSSIKTRKKMQTNWDRSTSKTRLCVPKIRQMMNTKDMFSNLKRDFQKARWRSKMRVTNGATGISSSTRKGNKSRFTIQIQSSPKRRMTSFLIQAEWMIPIQIENMYFIFKVENLSSPSFYSYYSKRQGRFKMSDIPSCERRRIQALAAARFVQYRRKSKSLCRRWFWRHRSCESQYWTQWSYCR